MNTNTKNLNEQIQTLITMLEEKASSQGTNGEMLFVPSLIEASQNIAGSHMLTAEELNLSDETEQKTELTDQLADFQRKVSGAYNFVYSGQKRPEWMKIGGMKHEEFFPQFFVQVEADTSLVDFLTHNNTNIQAIKTVFVEWKNILNLENQQQEVFKKVERMTDLKNLLIATLRMYGLSTFEVRAQLI